jgi:hypothetical protein
MYQRELAAVIQFCNTTWHPLGSTQQTNSVEWTLGLSWSSNFCFMKAAAHYYCIYDHVFSHSTCELNYYICSVISCRMLVPAVSLVCTLRQMLSVKRKKVCHLWLIRLCHLGNAAALRWIFDGSIPLRLLLCQVVPWECDLSRLW